MDITGNGDRHFTPEVYGTLQKVTTVGFPLTFRHFFGASVRVTFGRHLSSLSVVTFCHISRIFSAKCSDSEPVVIIAPLSPLWASDAHEELAAVHDRVLCH
jgi:hypothetical protein